MEKTLEAVLLPQMFRERRRSRGGRAARREQARLEADEKGHSYGTPPLLPYALPRSARRYRHPYLDSGAVLCCYGNSVGSLAAGRRQWLCGIQHWKQQLCPSAVVVTALLSDEDTLPLPSQEAKGKPWDLGAVTRGSAYSRLSMRAQAPPWRGSLPETLPGASPSIASFPGRFLFIFLVDVFISSFVHSFDKCILCTYYARF